jgi:2-C-methyl-D-erythritol 4-phosphate cytidylyltransferase
MGKVVAIITAGGSGKRIKSDEKKQYIELNQRPVLFWTLDKFIHHSLIDDIIISLPENDIPEMQIRLKNEFSDYNFNIVKGGKERQDSVFNALCACSKNTNLVLIHDGVRPFIDPVEISELIEIAKLKKAVIPVTKVKNTIKEIDESKVVRTVPRHNLVATLTPQVFDYNLIVSHHMKAFNDRIETTDDASILEHYGVPVYYLECSSKNIKITNPIDLQIAKSILDKEEQTK